MQSIEEVPSFLEDSLCDDQINDVSVLIGYDGSRCSDVCLEVGCWARKNNGIVSLHYIIESESTDITDRPEMIENQAKCSLELLGNEKNYNFESYKRPIDESYKPIIKIINDKYKKENMNLVILGMIGKSEISTENISKKQLKIVRSVRKSLYSKMNMNVIYVNPRQSLKINENTKYFVYLSPEEKESEIIVKKSCEILPVKINSEIYMYYIESEETNIEFIKSLKHYYERKSINVEILVERQDIRKKRDEQILNKIKENMNVSLVIMGNKVDSELDEKSLSIYEYYSTAEYIIINSNTHIYIINC